MVVEENIYEYELVNVIFELPYGLLENDVACYMVGEKIQTPAVDASDIEYDADGVPMGNTHEDVVARRQIIHEFIQRWRAEHVEDSRIFNEDLKDYVKINQLFLLESVAHAAGHYLSTKAVLRMEDIIRKAKLIGLSKKKEGDKNQKPFQHMAVMLYKCADLGNVKIVVGIRLRTQEKVQYSITVPQTGTPFIDKGMRKDEHTGKKKRKKRSK